MTPGYISSDFFDELKPLIEEQKVGQLTFTNYTKLKDKGIAEEVAASIPIDQIQFRKYIDGLDTRDPFVGVWQTDDGRYTLGMIQDKRDPLHKFKMFVIEAKHKNWKPGEIKVQFARIDEKGIATARYRGGNKAEVGLTFNTAPDVITSINSPFNKQVVLIKTYPSKSSISRNSTGTSWYIGDRLFVTNAHVIDGADKIDLIINDLPRPARVSQLRKDAIMQAKETPVANEDNQQRRM